MRENLFITVVIYVCVCLLGGILGNLYYRTILKSDGLDEWRRPDGVAIVEVIFEGDTYYCEYSESIAGYPGKLLLYRDDGGSYLLLPDKIAIANSIK